MLNINIDDVTIAMPLATHDNYTKKLIQYFIDNFSNKIVIIYRDGSPIDYVEHPRVKYVKNKYEKIHPTHLNQAILESETEYVCLTQWKFIFTKDDLNFAISKLKEGFGIVDLAPCLGTSIFSKHLISIIGFRDEWMTHNADHEWDIICRLKHYDIAIYQEKKVTKISSRTVHQGIRKDECWSNYIKMSIKWKNTPDGFERVIPEKNFKDKQIYKDKFADRDYLKFKNSIIQFKYAIERCNLWNSGITLDFAEDDPYIEDQNKLDCQDIEIID